MFPNNQNNNQTPNNNNNNGQGPQGGPPGFDWRRWLWPALLLLLLGWTLFRVPDMFSGPTGPALTVPYSQLVEEIDGSNVESMIVREQTASGVFRSSVTVQAANGQAVSGTRFQTVLPPGDNEVLLDRAIAQGARVNFQQTEINPLLLFLFNWGPLLLLIAFFIWMARRTQRQMGGAFNFGRTQAREYTVERPKVTFDDVAGQDAAKRELEEIVDFLREPDKYIALGARIPRGVLLIGPPGTGKTLLARAVAGEASVSFFSIAASEFVEMFVGVGASRVRDLFKRAKDNAPAIVFIDEIDAVGRQRGAGLGGGHDEREQTLNQMLAEMDGFDQTESVIVMAATNRPDVLDPALLRPGRFDRQVTVGLPDRNGREAILKIHTRGKPLDGDVQLPDLARSTIGFSGADISNLANEAALNAARRNARKISMRDFSDAFDRIVLGTESPPLSNKREREVTAYHEAGHALIAALVPQANPVLKVTIVPRGQALGVTAFMPADDLRNYSTAFIRATMLVALGGRAAEKVVFDEITTGAADDLRRVTSMARRMVAEFGMSEEIGPLNFGENQSQPFLGYSLSQNRTYSEETAAQIDRVVRNMVEHAYEETLRILSENRDKLDLLAQALLEKEVISRNEMYEVIGMELPYFDGDNVFAETVNTGKGEVDPMAGIEPQAEEAEFREVPPHDNTPGEDGPREHKSSNGHVIRTEPQEDSQPKDRE